MLAIVLNFFSGDYNISFLHLNQIAVLRAHKNFNKQMILILKGNVEFDINSDERF